MLKESDNTAFALLTRYVGVDKTEEFIKNLGLKNTSFTNNDTSPEDVGIFLEKLYNKEFLLKDYQEQMLGFMQNTTTEDRLPYYLSGVKIAHKIGSWDGAYSDAGIVYSDKGNYIIVVMTENASYEEAVNLMRKLSEVVYYYFNK